MNDRKAIETADRDHLFYPWSRRDDPRPLFVARAEGSHFWDQDGKRYLDFASQFVHTNVGHQHPRVVAAIREQAQVLCTVSPALGNAARARAAALIASHAPRNMNRVFFTCAGTEAMEHATRMARLSTGRPKLLSAYRSYHGATTTSIHLTGESRRWPSDTGAAGVSHFFGPYLYRSAFHAADEAEEAQRALEHLRQVIEMEGPSTIAAVVLETVVGTNGVLVPPGDYLPGVRRLCDEHGIMLIADEIMVGFGRTGRWFAVDHWGVAPDMITFAKGVNSGYVPLGGVILADHVAESFTDRPYPGGMTYAGHPLACAAAVAALTVLEEEDLIGRAARLGETVLGPWLRAAAERHPSVGDVRGIGAIWALELVSDRSERIPLTAPDSAVDPMRAVAKACHERGLWPMLAGNRIHLTPPLNLSDGEAAVGLEILDAALAVADRYCDQ